MSPSRVLAGPSGRMRPPRRDPYGLSESWTGVDGRRVRSLSAGVPAGLPDVVLLPGLGAPGYLVPWARQISSWTRVTVLDLPGWHGGSARSCPPTLEGVAQATVGWLDAADRRDVLLVGHSTGAQAAVLVACGATDRLTGLVLAGPTFEPGGRSLSAATGRALTTIVREGRGVAEVTVPSYVHSGGLPLLRFVRSALLDRPEVAVHEVGVPVTVMTGRDDAFCPPAWGAELARRAGTVCHVLEGGHTAQYENPLGADELLRGAARDGRTTCSPCGSRTVPVDPAVVAPPPREAS